MPYASSHSVQGKDQYPITKHESQKRTRNAKSAKEFLNKTLPKILRSSKRARDGIAASRLIVNPPVRQEPSAPGQANTQSSPICCKVADTLEVAWELSQKHIKGRIAILNMASPLRPGGGILTGATSQEESLCSRTTLYPSLRDEFYRLPEIGGVYSPDVLVCCGWDSPSPDLLPMNKRFFLDVVTAAMLRFPDLSDEPVIDGSGGAEQAYTEEADRGLMLDKMRAVMRIVHSNGVDGLVLGAWGCGAYRNPVREIAQGWEKVLLGVTRGKRARELWPGIEVVFAIKNRKMAEQFVAYWAEDILLSTDFSSDSKRIDTQEMENGGGRVK